MQSIPVAMTWEMLASKRWQLLAFALGANALPAFLLTALRQHAVIDPTDTSMLTLHVMLTQLNTIIFACALFDAVGQPSRLYALPISTGSLVAWQMIPAMTAMAVESVVSTVLINAAFDMGWPLWGPALFAVAGVNSILAVLWTTEKSGWIVIAMLIPSAILGLWFKSHFGPTFSLPAHPWVDVTPIEVFGLLMFSGLSYYVAVIGVARRRCGESLPSLGVIAFIERLFDPPPEFGPPFSSPLQAQYWMEWRRKGWAMPAVVLFGMFIGLSIWGICIRDVKELFEGFVAGGSMLTLSGLLGLLLGNVGSNDTTFEMGHFLATRPLTNSELSRTTLKVLARSVLTAWSIWAVPFLALYAILYARQAVPDVKVLNDFGWWYFPATLLGCWAVVSVFAMSSMTGRTELPAQLICGLLAASVGLDLFRRFVLPESVRMPFDRGVSVTIAALLLFGTVWTFVAARRRSLIGRPTVGFAASAWTLLSGLIVLDWALHPARPWLAGLLAVSAAALVVAPLAAAPLALAWNRNR
jgi:uncharacterized membrane protein YdcZ (DUF606 family)